MKGTLPVYRSFIELYIFILLREQDLSWGRLKVLFNFAVFLKTECDDDDVEPTDFFDPVTIGCPFFLRFFLFFIGRRPRLAPTNQKTDSSSNQYYKKKNILSKTALEILSGAGGPEPNTVLSVIMNKKINELVLVSCIAHVHVVWCNIIFYVLLYNLYLCLNIFLHLRRSLGFILLCFDEAYPTPPRILLTPHPNTIVLPPGDLTIVHTATPGGRSATKTTNF